MVMTDAKAIMKLCNSWRSAAMQPDGSLTIGGDSEKFRLLANSVSFHDLDYDAMRSACIGLSAVLLLPGLNTVVDHDHSAFWSWCAELLCGSRATYFGQAIADYPLRTLMELTFRASLVGAYRPDKQGWEQARAVDSLLDVHTQAWKRGAHTALTYLAFPLLEGVVKRKCSHYVEMDGTILHEWSTTAANGRPQTHQVGRRCSSLWSLLDLLKTLVACEELRDDLANIEDHLATYSDDGSPGFKVLYDWRNGSLHGASMNGTVGGTVLNTAILIALSDIRDNYDAIRQQTLEQVQRDLRYASSDRSPWSYYPPYT